MITRWWVVPLLFATPAMAQYEIKDSMVAAASQQYAHPALLKRIFLGSNYRKEWQTPVKMPVFYLSKTSFNVTGIGGGQQTVSLQLVDKKGKEWALRSVDKDVSKALPPRLRNGFVKGMTQDMISAAHPYAPLTIPTLASAIGVVVPRPVIVYVADDPALGKYRDLFANTVCLLEQKEPTPDGNSTKNTEKLIERLFSADFQPLDQEALLKARLLDMLLGDWDRHADQWRWGTKDSAGRKFFYPIPRDRDQAYFYSNGILVKFVQVFALKHLVSFNDELKKIKSQNYKAWPFDRFLLNTLDRDDWERTIKNVQASLSDSVIRAAMNRLPPEIYNIRGANLERKMRGRRDDLFEEGMKYYHFIAGNIAVYGTRDAELFDVSGNDKELTVRVYDYADGRQGRLLYERSFDPDDTFALTLFGNEGNDRYIVHPAAKARIKLTMNGEAGNDTYNVQGGWKNIVADERTGSRIENDNKTQLALR